MADVWKQIAKELNTLLAPRGFQQSGLKFVNRVIPEVIRAVTVSKFRWNMPGDFRFQLIVSVYLATGDTGEFDFPGCAGRYSIVFERSTGDFVGDESLLYRVPAQLPLEELDERLRANLESRVLPFLDSCSSIDATIGALDKYGNTTGHRLFSMQLAIALARLGRVEESRILFLRTPGDESVVRQVAATYGITI